MKNNVKILIVEDSELIRESLLNALSELTGADIVGYANNSMDAIAKYFEFQPDILILDLMLNWSSGIEVMKYIKKYRTESNKVILFSNITNPFIRNHCFAVGADYCLDKSNDFQKLILICNEIVLDHVSSSTAINKEVIKFKSADIISKRIIRAFDFIYSPLKFISQEVLTGNINLKL